MIAGHLRDVNAVVSGDESAPSYKVFGVFPTDRQAEGYIREQTPDSNAKVVAYRGFQIEGGSPRVLLFRQIGYAVYELDADYEPEADRLRRELKQSAWSKLTAAERDAIGWSREP